MNTIPHNKIVADESDVAAVTEVIRSGRWAMGPVTKLLEQKLAAVCQRKFAVAVASGSSALRLAMLALDIKPGDHVGVPAYSCVALANVPLSIGAKPVPIDCDGESLNISLDGAEAATISKLRCIVGVNMFGYPANFAALERLKLPLIEDCAHGFGIGAMGNQGSMTIISLHATKFIGSGRGGAILTDEGALVERLLELREYDDKPASRHGLNEKPDDLNSALALSRLSRLDEFVERRRQIAMRYQEALSAYFDGGQLSLPPDSPDRIWYRYAIRTDDAAQWKWKLRLLDILAEHPVDSWLPSEALPSVPHAATAYHSVLSLPLYLNMSHAEQDRVIAAVSTLAKEVS